MLIKDCFKPNELYSTLIKALMLNRKKAKSSEPCYILLPTYFTALATATVNFVVRVKTFYIVQKHDKIAFWCSDHSTTRKIAITQTTVPQRKETYSVQKRTAYRLSLQINSLS